MPVYDDKGEWVSAAIPKGEKKVRGGLSPRRTGDRVERIIAKELGEKRNVGSGAFKNTNKNLTGDLDIRDAKGRAFIKLEIKYTGQVTTKGEKVYPLTTKVLEQMEKEAHDAGEIGALTLQFKGGKKYEIMTHEDFLKLVEWARLGRNII
jgi:hypothetical protein